MGNIKLISDSACDLTVDECQKFDVSLVQFHVIKDDCEKLYTNEELYNEMLTNRSLFFKTGCPSPTSYYDEFEKACKENMDVCCVCITKDFSGSYNSALVAKGMILEEYPDRNILIVNSETLCILQGLLVLEIRKMIDKGYNLSQIEEKLERLKEGSNIFLTVENLKYLKVGGRISGLKSLITGSLQIKPILQVNRGSLKHAGFGIGIMRTLKAFVNKAKDIIDKFSDRKFKFIVGYTTNKELSQKLLDNLKTTLNLSNEDIELKQMGIVTACHTGPNSLGFGFFEKLVY